MFENVKWILFNMLANQFQMVLKNIFLRMENIVNKFGMMDILKYLNAGSIITKFCQIVFNSLPLIIE